MSKMHYLQSLKHQAEEKKESAHAFFDVYQKPESCSINRDGIFHSLFNEVFDSRFTQIPHVLLSRFEVFKGVSEFYRIKSGNDLTVQNSSKIVIIFNLNLRETPLELLNDFLRKFSESCLMKYPQAQIAAIYNYDLDLANPTEQKYLISYFQVIQKYLKKLPELVTLIELQKKASFYDTIFVEAGTQWACLDNYLVHVALSKGAALIQPELDVNKFKIITEHVLSPNHCLQVLKKVNPEEFDIASPFLEDLKGVDFFKNPDAIKLFHYLMYENIFNN